MFRRIVLDSQQIQRRSGFLAKLLLLLVVVATRLKLWKKSEFSPCRFLSVTKLSFSDATDNHPNRPPIEVLFVAAGKDFLVLPYSIMAASRAVSHHADSRISLVVPEKDLASAKGLCEEFKLNVNIVCENDLISSELRIKLNQEFGWRFGWVLQQILKVTYVSKSSARAVLVVDADTLLTTKRNWFFPDGRQLLTPSYEYHQNYYRFLHRVGISEISPKFTFVPHHMIMQPEYLLEALQLAGWLDQERMVSDLITHRDPEDISPFCIEYELYAQYLINFKPNSFNIEKWANIGISLDKTNFRNQLEDLLNNSTPKFASVSLHSYL